MELGRKAVGEDLLSFWGIEAERKRRPQNMVYYKTEDKSCGLKLKKKMKICLIFCPQSLPICRAGPSNLN